VLSECLTPVADQKQAGAKQQKATNYKETDTYIFGLSAGICENVEISVIQ